MRESFSSREKYTGAMHEEDLLGTVSREKYLASLGKTGKSAGEYVPYSRAVELVRASQKGDPTNPDRPLAKDLRIGVIEALEERGVLKPGEEDRVKYFTAVGTHLDVFHKTDAFIEFENPKTRHRDMVTLDISLKSGDVKRDEGARADVILTDVPDPDTEEDAYLIKVDELAERIADYITNPPAEREARKTA